MKTRFIYPVGTRAQLRIYWDGGPCTKNSTYHNAMKHLEDSDVMHDVIGGTIDDHPDDEWPTACQDCGTPVPADGKKQKQVFRKTLYTDGTSWRGFPGPGDMFYADWYACTPGPTSNCHYRWTNCHGGHLMVICPNGAHWDTGSRASNCTMPEETTHRCWVVHGDPRTGVVHVDKTGHTCGAGGGSIIAGDYHGFLHNGILT